MSTSPILWAIRVSASKNRPIFDSTIYIRKRADFDSAFFDECVIEGVQHDLHVVAVGKFQEFSQFRGTALSQLGDGFPAGLGLCELLHRHGVEKRESRVNRGDFALFIPYEIPKEGDFEGVFLPRQRQLRVLLRQESKLAQDRIEWQRRFSGSCVEEESEREFPALGVEEATAVEHKRLVFEAQRGHVAQQLFQATPPLHRRQRVLA